MTLLDAPKFDAVRDRRNRAILFGSAGLFAVLVIASWFVAGMPVDFPWNWWAHFRGRSTANHFLTAVEHNDLGEAYAVWTHDPDWKNHPQQHVEYPFTRFEQDWSSTSSGNDYGAIKSHHILAARMNGNVLIMGIRINGLKSNTLFLSYEPKTRMLGFSPVELYLGP